MKYYYFTEHVYRWNFSDTRLMSFWIIKHVPSPVKQVDSLYINIFGT